MSTVLSVSSGCRVQVTASPLGKSKWVWPSTTRLAFQLREHTEILCAVEEISDINISCEVH